MIFIKNYFLGFLVIHFLIQNKKIEMFLSINKTLPIPSISTDNNVNENDVNENNPEKTLPCLQRRR
jgi:hypothetical protein